MKSRGGESTGRDKNTREKLIVEEGERRGVEKS
jgi:hypothetical protein